MLIFAAEWDTVRVRDLLWVKGPVLKITAIGESSILARIETVGGMSWDKSESIWELQHRPWKQEN